MQDERHFTYSGSGFADPQLAVIEYRPELFAQALELESECFAALREQNGITPYRIADSEPGELDRIARFFELHKSTYLFTYDGANLAATIMFLGNRIQSLCVAPRYRRRGYGTRLTKLAVNTILGSGCQSVELDVLPGNTAAERLCRRLGFRETAGT